MKEYKLFIKTKILNEIFEFAPKRYQEKNLDNHPLSRKLSISGKELKNNIEFLIELGLIHREVINEDGNRIYNWVITDKGFDYLEKKSGERKQGEFNKMVAFTGGIIALTAIYSFLVESVNLKSYPGSYWSITLIFLILVLFCIGPLVTFIFNFWIKEVFGR